MRFISQLSFLQSYVYPGGTHDRFSHSLGAMHVAGRLFGRVIAGSKLLQEIFSSQQLAELRERVRFAGLLHDIGHGPFSHSSEVLFPKLSELPLNQDWWTDVPDRQAKHEDYSVLLIQTLAQKEGVFDRSMAQDVASLVHGGVKPSDYFSGFEEKAPGIHKILKALISGEVDCDRMDYLLRDAYFCGVSYGKFDIDWLIASMGVAWRENKLIFTITENGVRAFEDVLLARYHMIDQVYFHKTKSGFHENLEQAFRLGEVDLTIPTDPYEYADMRDGKVIEMMFKAAKQKKNYWSRNVVLRRPAKRIMRLHEAKPEDRTMLLNLTEFCENNSIKYYTRRASSNLSDFGELKEKDRLIYVAKTLPKGHQYIPIEQYSNLLQKYNEHIQFTDFFVRREDYNRFKEHWA